MGIYVITGGTTGIGAVTREKLQMKGHTVYNVDYKGGDFCADLSQPEGRHGALEAIHEKFPEGIDGIICNAGVGPVRSAEMIFALNFFASVEMAEGVRDLLIKKGGCCVVTSSNSITNQTVRPDWVDMISNVMDERRILEFAKEIPAEQRASAYSSSKHALARSEGACFSTWSPDKCSSATQCKVDVCP